MKDYAMNVLLDSFKKTIRPHKRWNESVYVGCTCSFFHNDITVYFLFGCFLLVSSQQHFGNPLQCLADTYLEIPAIPENVLNNYCFMSTTYSVVDSSPNNEAYPGISPDVENAPIRRHAYYQWVPLVLLLQAALFMIPHWLWKGCEGGLVKRIVTTLDEDLERSLPQLKRPQKLIDVAEYFYKRLGESNRILGIAWIFCDILALINVVANFYLIDVLFNGMFVKFGLTALKMVIQEPFQTPVFPLLTKCSFHTYGSSGSVQRFDSICVMTLNVVNEKVYVLLWTWFFILAHLTVLFIFIKLVRILILKYSSGNYMESTIGVPTIISGKDLEKCASIMSFGDCVLFHLMAKNMRPMTYKRFVECLANQIDFKKGEKFL